MNIILCLVQLPVLCGHFHKLCDTTYGNHAVKLARILNWTYPVHYYIILVETEPLMMLLNAKVLKFTKGALG